MFGTPEPEEDEVGGAELLVVVLGAVAVAIVAFTEAAAAAATPCCQSSWFILRSRCVTSVITRSSIGDISINFEAAAAAATIPELLFWDAAAAIAFCKPVAIARSCCCC